MPYDGSPEVTTRERMVRLRNFLVGLDPENFNMSYWNEEFSCGTVCCIGEWAERLFALEDIGEMSEVGELLGLDSREAYALFCPTVYSCYESNEERGIYTHKQAIQVLDIYLEEGVIDWPRAIREA